jgi:hypothetical protein
MTETAKPFSFARAALSGSRAADTRFLSVYQFKKAVRQQGKENKA